MDIIVTIGAGFIRSNLVKNFLDYGEEIVVQDDMHTGSLSNLDHEVATWRLFRPAAMILKQDLKPEAIYHLGTPSSTSMYRRDPFLVAWPLTAIFPSLNWPGSSLQSRFMPLLLRFTAALSLSS
jgi:nucleoside-diphosphate-sugar epimerase